MDNKLQFIMPAAPNEAQLRQQAWRFYSILIAWPLYLFFAPVAVDRLEALGFVVIMLPGILLFNCLCLLHHESWHRYVPGIPNRLFFFASGIMLFTDPQIFDLIHKHHHSRVSTWDDIEVHPFGYIEKRWLRILNNFLEMIFGMLYIMPAWYFNVPTSLVYKVYFSYLKFVGSVVGWVLFWGLLALLVNKVFAADAMSIFLAWFFSFWIGGLFLHHSTLIQHGNLIVSGRLGERNRWVRSLRPSGIFEKVFLVLTQQDQALHHWAPRIYWRVFRNNRHDWPVGGITISFREYGRLLFDLLRGEETDHIHLGQRTPSVP